LCLHSHKPPNSENGFLAAIMQRFDFYVAQNVAGMS
jgi:hypothetical protein